jgi:AhpC/TSA family
MLPHERALVERLKNKPFALIGINTDPPEVFKDRAARENVSWRNILEGQGGGAIVRAFGVRAFPTIYVLDGTGMIRYTGVRGGQMDAAVDVLLAELAGQLKTPERHADKSAERPAGNP